MGYSTVETPLPIGNLRNKNKLGYSFKLCPYSSEYRDKFVYIGTLITGVDGNNNPVTQTGQFVLGNSTNQVLFGVDYSSYVCSDHTVTSGNMLQVSNPPGWMCTDPNCWYKVNMGKCYTEV